MIKFGIIGMGLRGNLFADTINKNRFAEVKAVCDYNQENANKASEKYGVISYKDYTEMIEMEDLDAVIVATPDFLHKDPVIKAAQKGMHIMVEKPFSIDPVDALEMKKEIDKTGVKCLVAFENRWNLPFVSVKEAIENGEVGNIIAMNSRLNDTIFVPTEMLKWSKDSSPGWFLLSHSIDMACWLSQKKVKRVYAVGTKKKLIGMGIDIYDSIQTTLTFEDNTHAVFTTSWVLPNSMPLIVDFKYEIIGEEGALYIDLHDQMVKYAGETFKHKHVLGTPVNGQSTAAPSYMLDAFIDNIRLNTEPIAGVNDGLNNTNIVYAIHKSIETGKIIDL